MASTPSIDYGWLHEQLVQASPDLLRAMVTTFAEALIGAEADAVCGSGFGERSSERRKSSRTRSECRAEGRSGSPIRSGYVGRSVADLDFSED